MKRLIIVVIACSLLTAAPSWAQRSSGDTDRIKPIGPYPVDILERYWECMERHDLDKIKELLWFHKNVERIDATIYGLPKDDFDDQSLLTIEERLRYREEHARGLVRSEPAQATKGPLQYPHHLRESLDKYYERTGKKPDCSGILAEAGLPGPPKTLGSSWASDHDLTTADTNDRGEVDIVIDYANPNRIMASSCPSGSAPDSSSNFITATTDWGQTWSYTAVGNNSGSTWECDPVSYYQRSTGRVYHSKIGCNTGSCGSTYTMMRYSTNNGGSWADCGRPDSNTGEDRQWHVVDNTPSSACYGNIYITWHNSNQEKVTTSTNDCASWATPTNLTGTYSAITPDINVAADGHAYVVWQNYSDATFKIAGSDDCGATWTSPSPTTVKTRLGDWKNNIPAQCQRGISTLPTVDVDRCSWSQYYGRVYMAMFDFDQSGCGSGPGCTDWTNACDYDVWFTYSDNQGSTWATPVNITRDILNHGDRVDSFMGYMRVDESDGSIYIGYHRTRLNPTQLSDRQKTHFFIARSIDGGATWEEWQVSSLEGDERVSGASTFERGDYNRVDVYQGVAYAVWIDRRNSGGEENVITRKICTEPAHRSERAPTFAAPTLTMSSPGAGTVDISWTAPDAQWGDGGEDNTQRKYQLWVDGSLAQDNISWTATSITGYDPGDCNSHTYFLRVINQCGISKDYQTVSYSATGCCVGNPDSVDVTPDGPLTLCTGTAQTLTANTTGGTTPFTYQWYRDGTAISGATSSTYSANDTGTHSYNCEVTGGGCSPGIMDSTATQITWQSEPDFGGVVSVTNAQAATCTLDLAWTAASSPCGGTITYNIYRSTTSGFTPSAANRITSGVGGTTYSDADSLVSGTTYYYIVRAVSSANGVEDTNTVERSDAPTAAGGGNQTLHSDDFEVAASWSDWTVTTGPGPHSCGDWARTNSSTQRPSAGSGYYALTDSDACGSGSTTSTTLTSPVIDCTDVTGNVNLSYDIYYKYWNGDDATVEVWNGSSWVVIWSDTNADINTSHLWDVSAYAVGNPNFQYRFNYQNAAYDYWFAVDNVLLTGDVAASCTTGGGCTDPGAVTIDSITDDDTCAQDGVTITYSGGSGATSFDLWVDGSQAATGISSPYSYDPGDTNSHSYVVRAVDGTCSTDSSSQSFTDEDNGVATATAPTVTDDDACAQDGVTITWTTASGATSYDLRIDGATTITGVTSPYSYDPGDTTSHSYEIRGTNASCTGAWSSATSATDANDQPGTPAITGITDEDSCAQSGIRINYTAGAGATSHNLVRDGSVVVNGYSSGALYNPGDSNSHSYVVRALNGSCSADSSSSAFTDTNDGVAVPGAPSVSDNDACAQSGVTISWSAVTGATGYDVRVDGTTTIYSGSGTSYSYNPGDTAAHTYDVRASNASCTSGWSNATTATDEAGAPGTPGAPSVTDVSACGQTGVQISWGAVSGATSYDLQIDGSTVVAGVSSPYTYSPGDTASHSYRIRAVNTCGTGTWSSSTSGTDADHSFSWSGIESAADRDSCDDTGVAIRWTTPSWNDGGAGSRSFTVYRDGATLSSGIGEAVTSVDDTTGTNGTSYSYSVEATNGYSCTAGGGTTASASDEVGGAPTFAGLQTVSGLPTGVCGLRLEWNTGTSNCGSGPVVYNVYRSTTGGFTPDGTTLYESCIADLYYEDTSVSGGTTYYYVVRAEDASSGHGGPCGGGFEDSNSVQVSGTVGSGTTTQVVYSDDFDGNQTPANYWNTGYTFGNPYTSAPCDSETYADDWHLPEAGGNCTGNTAASNDGTSPFAYTSPNNGALILGNPPTGSGPPYTDGGIVLPSGATSITLTFNHEWDFESDSNPWDGGRLMISDDNWPTFASIAPVGGYPGTTYNTTSYCHPWPNESAYTGSSGGCVSAEFDLTAYAGERVWLAWNHGADNYDTGDSGWFIDDVLIEAVVPGSACTTATAGPVQHFTARATSGAVKLEWENPSGTYGSTRICYDTGSFPTDPASCTVLVDQAGTAGTYDTTTHSGLTNGTTYYYAAFVDDGSGVYSAEQTVTARPFDTGAGQAKWAYHSAATALTPPGLYPGAAGTGAAYGVSNDRVVHGMNSTTAGGDWPRTSPFAWMPASMNGPAQDRPPIVATTVGAADLVVFLGSEDGHVYAVDAKTGATLWQSANDYGELQASPAGMFSVYGGAYDLLFIGTRNGGSGNEVVALNVADGSEAWTYGGTLGIISSGATVDYGNNRLYFASRENPSGSTDTLHCISFTDTGATPVWSEAYGDIDAAPILYDGALYVGTNAGVVYSVDPSTGDKNWAYETGDGPIKGFVSFEFSSVPRQLFFATTNSVWSVTDGGGGSVSLAWQQAGVTAPSVPLNLTWDTTPAIYVGSTDGKLYQLDAATGAVVTSEQLGDGTAAVGSPGYDWMNSLAYVGAEDGSIYAVVLPLQ